MKINFNTSFQGHMLKSFSELVGRDSEGQIVGMKIILNDYIPSSFAGEAIACLQGVQMGLDLDFQRVILEGDSITMENKLQNEKEDVSKISPIIEYVKKASRGFVDCRFSFMGRNTNVIAHCLAKEGFIKGETTYLMKRILEAVWTVAEKHNRWAEIGH
ncbi:hypothetical protein PVK06_043255 [Gossypium arboreum]|uniref:RNase H type-1 domain-containing protein n=1 Tax=Gossypium arboreum TaxID=29729 RepID=A0ABR0MN02_GOSAR|nr:hypothetical protein PVK06_043255 [Gossypium arboreum]